MLTFSMKSFWNQVKDKEGYKLCTQYDAGRINARRAPDEFDHLFKFGSAQLSHDLLNACLMSMRTAAIMVSDTPSAAATFSEGNVLATAEVCMMQTIATASGRGTRWPISRAPGSGFL
jgi:hypothetical protein